mgnify:CR=1 FL=1
MSLGFAFEGCAGRAAFQAGVAAQCHEDGLQPACVTGASSGSIVAALVAVFAVAGPRANPRKGKVYYKKNCRVCHDGSTDATSAVAASRRASALSSRRSLVRPVSTPLALRRRPPRPV